MAWRPHNYLQEGALDNTQPGKVTGWMKFAGMKDKVTFDLIGNFHRDIRGAKIHLRGKPNGSEAEAKRYLKCFNQHQTGNVGDMTAGLPPHDYGTTCYLEWYGEANGRVVLELDQDQIEIVGKPIPACESDPISRKEQAQNMAQFLCGLASQVGIPQQQSIAIGDTEAVEHAKKVIANDKIRGMKLLPPEIREILPSLNSQEGKGGKAIVYLKLFTPDSGFSWWITEGQPVTNGEGQDDYEFFGLVQGHEKELGYFRLSELEEVRGPMGLPIERDLHFKPTPLKKIAPELFGKSRKGNKS